MNIHITNFYFSNVRDFKRNDRDDGSYEIYFTGNCTGKDGKVLGANVHILNIVDEDGVTLMKADPNTKALYEIVFEEADDDFNTEENNTD